MKQTITIKDLEIQKQKLKVKILRANLVKETKKLIELRKVKDNGRQK